MADVPKSSTDVGGAPAADAPAAAGVDDIGPLPAGLPEFESEYREISVHYRAMMRALREGTDLTAFGLSLHNLIREVRRHFVAEEAMMGECGFPDLDSHRQEHERFLRDAEDFLYSASTRFEKADCWAVAKYFKYWFKEHAARFDQDVARFVLADPRDR